MGDLKVAYCVDICFEGDPDAIRIFCDAVERLLRKYGQVGLDAARWDEMRIFRIISPSAQEIHDEIDTTIPDAKDYPMDVYLTPEAARNCIHWRKSDKGNSIQKGMELVPLK